MALQKQNLNVDFSQGLDTKTDPFQVAPGKFLRLENSIFQDGKRLSKRNGFAQLTLLPDGSEASTLTTFNGNLTAIGNQVYAYSQASDQWEARGRIQPLMLSVQSLVRSSYSQTAPDVAVSPNGLSCSVFLDGDGVHKYQIADYTTGQTLIGITSLPTGANVPRVFLLGVHFVITFLINAGGIKLQYIAVPTNNLNNPTSAVTVSSSVSSTSAGYDGSVSNGILYLAWDGSDGGGAIRVTYVDSSLTQHNTIALPGHQSSLMSVTIDNTANTDIIWVTAYKTNNAYSYALNPTLIVVLAATQTITGETVNSITSVASDMLLTIFYELPNTYSYSAVATDYLKSVTCTQVGVVGTPAIIARSVGLASEAFLIGSVPYMLTAYSGAFQPSYFLIDYLGNVVAKLAYSNGGGYATTQVLPSVTVTGSMAQMGYLFKDLLLPVNKNTNPTAPGGVYSQTGVNIVSFNLAPANLSTAEIGSSLLIAGGITWMYDGVKPVELGFNLWAEDILATPSAAGGSMADQQYYYQVVYEWTDGQGIIHRSAPSIAVGALVSGGGGSGSVVLNIPTLRLTYKTAPNAVRIVIYRWSTAQQNFYQITSITSPVVNDPSIDSIVYTDTQNDTSIIGNSLIYTTGGVIENIAPPGTSIIALFGSRVFLVDDEDANLLWYSKQVIENTPVEMSDLFTIFVAPTSGAQGSTGHLTALAPMDDKLVMFKNNAVYYLVGRGPDNAGAQNDFSDPVFINSTVGCNNQQSVAFIPQGLTFQSDKGMWLLGRNLSTEYFGAPVESFNDQVVTSSVVIPGTNQTRFTLATGASSTLYQSLHTILTAQGVVFQETPNLYLDGNIGTMLMYDYYFQQWGTFKVKSGPTLMSFTSGWINLAGVQGSERAYLFTLLGQFLSPHKLYITMAYDYNPSPSQSTLITPLNYAGVYGDTTLSPTYGSQSPYGGPGALEQWRIFFKQQKLQSFQISIEEQFNPQYGTIPGAGFTLSGLNIIVGMRKGYTHNIPASNYAG